MGHCCSERPAARSPALMLLFLSDLHLGRGTPTESRAAEGDGVALLAAHADRMVEPGGGLVLLGDVFNAFIEYRSLVPKGFVRLQGALAALVDAGVSVTYVVGNRDSWHLRYFEEEIGVRLVQRGFTCQAYGHALLAVHGDGEAPAEWVANGLRPLLRHPLAYRLYRNALPGDWGFRLARWVADQGSGEVEPPVVEGIRQSARRHLANSDLVVMGHSHHAELTSFPEGIFLNPGYWFAHRTFGVLDAEGPRLLRWDGLHAEAIAALPRKTSTQTPSSFRNTGVNLAVTGSNIEGIEAGGSS